MNSVLDAFARMSSGEAFAWMLVENLALFLLAVGVGEGLVRAFRSRAVGPPPGPIEGREVGLALTCVALNAVVTFVGWKLWLSGAITIRRDTGFRAWLDVAVLLLMMDVGMYLTHRIAHHPWIYPVLHAAHHRYHNPRPLDLFVLHPLEVAGFGGLWLTVIALYSASWLGISAYLALNLGFGMIGHLGVEPFPRRWARLPLIREVGTSTFHAGHHHDRTGNFGFYTLIWDRLFGTLDPGYDIRFGRDERRLPLPGEAQSPTLVASRDDRG